MTKRLTKTEFVKKSILIHGDIYDYSRFNYINNHTKGIIICPVHGKFYQRPKDHMSGTKCPLCRGNLARKMDRITFIKKANVVHKNKYSYKNFKYKGYKVPGTIVCSIHGPFKQTPAHHLAGTRCPLCCIDERRTSLIDFITQANKIHYNIYDYSFVIYKNNKSKIKIICPKHGEFFQRPKDHLNGSGCPRCFSIISKEEKLFLEYLQSKSPYKIFGQNDNRYKQLIPFVWEKIGCQYKPDGLIIKPNLEIIEYNGDFWHGYSDDTVHPIIGINTKQLTNQLKQKTKIYEKAGFVVHNILSSEWKNFWRCGRINNNIRRLFHALNVDKF